jgi:hypothetical protein
MHNFGVKVMLVQNCKIGFSHDRGPLVVGAILAQVLGVQQSVGQRAKDKYS